MMGNAPGKSDMFDVFMRALVGAHRVVVQARNALGSDDSHYLHAPDLLAAMNARADLAPAPRVRKLEWKESDRGFRWEETSCGGYVIFYKSGGRATLSYGATTITIAEFNGDNMGVKCKAAAQADYEARILAALELAPAPSWQPIATP